LRPFFQRLAPLAMNRRRVAAKRRLKNGQDFFVEIRPRPAVGCICSLCAHVRRRGVGFAVSVAAAAARAVSPVKSCTEHPSNHVSRPRQPPSGQESCDLCPRARTADPTISRVAQRKERTQRPPFVRSIVFFKAPSTERDSDRRLHQGFPQKIRAAVCGPPEKPTPRTSARHWRAKRLGAPDSHAACRLRSHFRLIFRGVSSPAPPPRPCRPGSRRLRSRHP
jgi:hypothetical protein